MERREPFATLVPVISWRPFPEVSAAIAWLRLTLLLATGSGLALSAPLWWSDRFFPLLPVAGWFPVLTGPWDRLLFAAMLASLMAALRWYRPAVGFFLVATLFLYFGDQHRGQPWIYIYWILLTLTLLPGPAAIGGSRLVLAGVYVWSGAQKLHPGFFAVVVPWFVSPAAEWALPAGAVTALRWAVSSAPVAELFIGLGVWMPLLRRPALATAVVVHLAALVFLGPPGHGVNVVVWPWNVAMPVLLVLLFPAEPRRKMRPALDSLAQTPAAALLVAAVCLLPLLGLFGRWDRGFSFALYSGNQATADIFVSEALSRRLPARMRPFVREVRHGFNPVLQGPFLLDYVNWGMKELGAPPLLEARSFRVLFRFVRSHATNDSEARMLMVTRPGSLTFYQGDEVRVVPPAPP